MAQEGTQEAFVGELLLNVLSIYQMYKGGQYSLVRLMVAIDVQDLV